MTTELRIHIDLFPYFALQDYLRYSVKWLTPILIFAGLGIAFELFTRRIEGGATEAEIMARCTPAQKAFRRSGHFITTFGVPIITVLATATALLVKDYLWADLYILWGFTGWGAWLTLASWYASKPQFVSTWNVGMITFIKHFPALVIFSIFLGLSDAERHLQQGPHITTRIVLDGRQQPLVGNILFHLSDYLIIRGGFSDQALAIPSREVKMILYDE